MNVAILLSTYNGEKYLEEQLDSLLLQSYQDFVVYIRDDGSSDRTVNIINQYVMKDNRFINVGNSENLGCAASFINLLRNASADIYMFCDQDDYWLPNKLQRAVDYFSAIDPLQPTLYHCDLSVVDEKLNIIQNSFLPFFKLLTRAKFITNIDGLEWRRDKWNSKVKRFLKFSEKIAVQYSDVVITDNEAISEYVFNEYNKDSRVIAYGGDHAWLNTEDVFTTRNYKSDYYLSVCRIEPENNVELILKTFSKLKYKIKFIGNWNGSEFGKKLRLHYSNYPNIEMIDPIYDLQQLFHLRNNCIGYIHGHSAGGTNPSLVEAMHFSKPIFAYDCKFNRYTTENEACYFSNESDLAEKIIMHCELSLGVSGTKMKEIANQKYTWRRIAEMYEDCY